MGGDGLAMGRGMMDTEKKEPGFECLICGRKSSDYVSATSPHSGARRGGYYCFIHLRQARDDMRERGWMDIVTRSYREA